MSKKRIVSLLLAGILLASSVDTRVFAEEYTDEIVEEIVEETVSEILGEEASDIQGARSAIITAVKDFATSVDVSSFNIYKTDVDDIYYDISFLEPELFYLEELSCEDTESALGSVTINYVASTPADIEAMKTSFDAEISDFMSCVESNWCDFEKAMYLETYIAKHTSAGVFTTDNQANSAYGALVERKANAAGYAKAFRVLANKLGLENAVVDSNNFDHSWNMVKIGDDIYNIDVEADDKDGVNGIELEFDYFLLSDAGYADHVSSSKDWKIFGQAWTASSGNKYDWDNSYDWRGEKGSHTVTNGFEPGKNHSWYGTIYESDHLNFYRFTCNCEGDFRKAEGSLDCCENKDNAEAFVKVQASGANIYYNSKTEIKYQERTGTAPYLEGATVYTLTEVEQAYGSIVSFEVRGNDISYVITNGTNERITKTIKLNDQIKTVTAISIDLKEDKLYQGRQDIQQEAATVTVTYLDKSQEQFSMQDFINKGYSFNYDVDYFYKTSDSDGKIDIENDVVANPNVRSNTPGYYYYKYKLSNRPLNVSCPSDLIIVSDTCQIVPLSDATEITFDKTLPLKKTTDDSFYYLYKIKNCASSDKYVFSVSNSNASMTLIYEDGSEIERLGAVSGRGDYAYSISKPGTYYAEVIGSTPGYFMVTKSETIITKVEASFDDSQKLFYEGLECVWVNHIDITTTDEDGNVKHYNNATEVLDYSKEGIRFELRDSEGKYLKDEDGNTIYSTSSLALEAGKYRIYLIVPGYRGEDIFYEVEVKPVSEIKKVEQNEEFLVKKNNLKASMAPLYENAVLEYSTTPTWYKVNFEKAGYYAVNIKNEDSSVGFSIYDKDLKALSSIYNPNVGIIRSLRHFCIPKEGVYYFSFSSKDMDNKCEIVKQDELTNVEIISRPEVINGVAEAENIVYSLDEVEFKATFIKNKGQANEENYSINFKYDDELMIAYGTKTLVEASGNIAHDAGEFICKFEFLGIKEPVLLDKIVVKDYKDAAQEISVGYESGTLKGDVHYWYKINLEANKTYRLLVTDSAGDGWFSSQDFFDIIKENQKPNNGVFWGEHFELYTPSESGIYYIKAVPCGTNKLLVKESQPLTNVTYKVSEGMSDKFSYGTYISKILGDDSDPMKFAIDATYTYGTGDKAYSATYKNLYINDHNTHILSVDKSQILSVSKDNPLPIGKYFWRVELWDKYANGDGVVLDIPLEVVASTFFFEKNAIEIRETDAAVQLVLSGKSTHENIKYESSDETVAVVDANGKVSAVKPGKVTITATATNKENGSLATAVCTVTVKGVLPEAQKAEKLNALNETAKNAILVNELKNGKLSDISLPEGFSWKTPNAILSASDAVKEQSFAVIFTDDVYDSFETKVTLKIVAFSGIKLTGDQSISSSNTSGKSVKVEASFVGADLTDEEISKIVKVSFSNAQAPDIIVDTAKASGMTYPITAKSVSATKTETLKASTTVGGKAYTTSLSIKVSPKASVDKIGIENTTVYISEKVDVTKLYSEDADSLAKLIIDYSDISPTANRIGIMAVPRVLGKIDNTKKVKWTITDSSVATIDNSNNLSIAITIKKPGTTMLTATCLDDGKLSKNVLLEVKDYSPSLVSSSLKVNYYSKGGTLIELYENKENPIQEKGVTVNSSLLTVKNIDGRYYLARNAGHEVDEYKKAISTSITVKTEKLSPVEIPIKVSFIRTEAKATIKQNKEKEANIFYGGSSEKSKASFTVSSAAEILDVKLDEKTARTVGYDIDSYADGKLVLKAVNLTMDTVNNEYKSRNGSCYKVPVVISYKDYEDYHCTVTVKVVNKAPSLKLAAATVGGTADTVETSILGSADLSKVNLELVSSQEDFALVNVKGDGVFSIKKKGSKSAYSLLVKNTEWTNNIKLSGKVTTVKNYQLKAASTSLLLNADKNNSVDSLSSIKLSLANTAEKPANIKVTGANAAANELLSKYLDVSVDQTEKELKLYLKSGVASDYKKKVMNKSFKLIVSADDINGIPVKNGAVTVKLTDKKPDVRLTSKGSINATQRVDSAITYTATVLNLVEDVDSVELAGLDADLFEALPDNEKSAVFKVYARPEASLLTNQKYQLTVKVTLNESTVVEKPIVIKVQSKTSAIKATVKSGTIFRNAATAEIKNTLTPSLAGSEIEKVLKVKDKYDGIFTVSDIDENNQVTIGLGDKAYTLKNGKYIVTYQVYLKGQAANTKPVTVRTTVLLR